jgi:hypothetical protein
MLCRHALAGRVATLIALVQLCACSPSLDWREVRPEGSGVVALFPCKPTMDARMVTLDGPPVRMVLTACQAGDATWAVAFADATEPSRVAPALAALRAASVSNLGAAARVIAPMQVSGMTPNPQAERVRIDGKLPNGEAASLETGFFVKGTRVFQATVMGKAGSEPLAIFFDSLKLPS